MWHLKGSVEEGEIALNNLMKNISGFGFEPKLIYQKFDSKYEKGTLKLFSESGKEISSFEFNDVIFNKFSKSKSVTDSVALVAVTIGDRIKDTVESMRSDGEYRDYFYLSGFAAVLTEALTEFAHIKACKEYGFDRAKSFRLSPGYPVWPELSDQLEIDRLITLEKIDLCISEALQLIPEYSTTSVLFYVQK